MPTPGTVYHKLVDGLDDPRDLAFNPQHPGELWVVNREDDSTVIYFDVGTPKQRAAVTLRYAADLPHAEIAFLPEGRHYVPEAPARALAFLKRVL